LARAATSRGGKPTHTHTPHTQHGPHHRTARPGPRPTRPRTLPALRRARVCTLRPLHSCVWARGGRRFGGRFCEGRERRGTARCARACMLSNNHLPIRTKTQNGVALPMPGSFSRRAVRLDSTMAWWGVVGAEDAMVLLFVWGGGGGDRCTCARVGFLSGRRCDARGARTALPAFFSSFFPSSHPPSLPPPAPPAHALATFTDFPQPGRQQNWPPPATRRAQVFWKSGREPEATAGRRGCQCRPHTPHTPPVQLARAHFFSWAALCQPGCGTSTAA